jgi:hypothetical protein
VRNAAYAWGLQDKVILDGLKETGYLPQQEAYSSDVMFG